MPKQEQFSTKSVDDQPTAQFSFVDLLVDGVVKIQAADLPDDLGVLLLVGDRPVFIPEADVVDGRIVRHAQSTVVRTARAVQAQATNQEANRPNAAQIAENVRQRELEHFEAHRATYEDNHVQPATSLRDASVIRPRPPAPTPEALAPAPNNPNQAGASVPVAPVRDPHAFGEGGQFRVG